MPKATTPTAARQGRRHNPLEDDVVSTGLLRNKNGGKRRSKGSGADDEGDNFVDAKSSKNILRIGRELAEEEDAEKLETQAPPQTVDNFGYDNRFDDEAETEDKLYGAEEEGAWGDEDDEVVEEVEVDPEDLETYRRFLPDEEDELLKHGWDRKPTGEEQEESVNLADLIMAKIAAHEAGETRQAAGVPDDDDYELPPKVVEAYTKLVDPDSALEGGENSS